MKIFKKSVITASAMLFLYGTSTALTREEVKVVLAKIPENQRVATAVALFSQQVEGPAPKMSWKDFTLVMEELLQKTHANAATVIRQVGETDNGKKAGMRLLARAKEFPQEIADAIKKLARKAADLEQRFMAALVKKHYNHEELNAHIDELLSKK